MTATAPIVRAKLEALSLYYGNNNAWYGQPDAMLAGNPLVQGKPAGAGYSNWVEGYLHYGLYGITPITDKVYVYGGLSADQLRLDRARSCSPTRRAATPAVEDAYAGIVTGTTDEKGNRLVFNFSAGRQKFTLANAFLIANTAANGWDRAALQANARWASDMLVLGQIAYNSTKLEAFYVEAGRAAGDRHPHRARRPQSRDPPGQRHDGGGELRDGAEVRLRLLQSQRHDPRHARRPQRLRCARHLHAEARRTSPAPSSASRRRCQTHRDFDMFATAAYGELGYSFVDLPWSPVDQLPARAISPAMIPTPRPMSAGTRCSPAAMASSGCRARATSRWCRTATSSPTASRRASGRCRTVEVVPQLWAFQADSLNNIGGNPALSFLDRP